jgi:esterase/lipase superfamily enzyme
MQLRVRFATNRNPVGNPVRGFGNTFSPVHPHSLRFGSVALESGPLRGFDASTLADRFSEHLRQGKGALSVYAENLKVTPPVLGSTRMFGEIKADMDAGVGTVILIHGYDNDFHDAIGSALAFQYRLQSLGAKLNVVAFSWPSDGQLTPLVAYHHDREDAATSGIAFSRAFQRLYEFLDQIPPTEQCKNRIHLVCHSMGNFVLENTIWHLGKNLPGRRLPRVFSEVVLASPDVDTDALEVPGKFGRLTEVARRVTIYYNRQDKALLVSDLTKGNPDRLGTSGPKHPLDVQSGVVNVDCSLCISGFSEHSYYLDEVSRDIAETLKGKREDEIRHRVYLASANAYILQPK